MPVEARGGRSSRAGVADGFELLQLGVETELGSSARAFLMHP